MFIKKTATCMDVCCSAQECGKCGTGIKMHEMNLIILIRLNSLSGLINNISIYLRQQLYKKVANNRIKRKRRKKEHKIHHNTFELIKHTQQNRFNNNKSINIIKLITMKENKKCITHHKNIKGNTILGKYLPIELNRKIINTIFVIRKLNLQEIYTEFSKFYEKRENPRSKSYEGKEEEIKQRWVEGIFEYICKP